MATETSVMAVIRAYRPTFRNPSDKVAFALHSSFLAAGYVLTATGPAAFDENACSEASASEVGVGGWNELEDAYGFVYREEGGDSKKVVLVKGLVVGDNHLAFDVLDCQAEKEPYHLEIDVNAHVSDGEDVSSSHYGSVYKEFGSLINLFNSSVLEKLENTTKAAPSTSTRSEKTEIVDSHFGDFTVPYRAMEEPCPLGYSRFGDFNVPYRAMEEPCPLGFVVPPVLPSVESDLFPGPGAGMFPSRGGVGTGGGMLIGPNDPLWALDERSGIPRFNLGVPPGTRFDPYGPPGVPGFDPNWFHRNPQRRPGSHPDLEPFRDPDQPDFI